MGHVEFLIDALNSLIEKNRENQWIVFGLFLWFHFWKTVNELKNHMM